MKVFLSWSGIKSKKIAQAFKDWLPSVIQYIKEEDIFLSSEDIDKGKRWGATLATELENSNFGILCITNENKGAPWIIFEAGALSKFANESNVCSFLFDLTNADIDYPLSQFQSTIFEKDDILKLVKSLNKVCETKIEEQQLKKTFDSCYPELENKLENIKLENITTGNTEIQFWNEENPYTSKKIFGQNFRTKYQRIPILEQPNLSIETIREIYSRLCASINQDKKIWIDDEKIDEFSLIYVNTSVLYFFIQLGLELENPIIKKAHEYLDSIDKISIDTRAKWFFDIQTNRINQPELLNFLQEIESWQIQKEIAEKGAFLFRQEATSDVNRKSFHPGGSSFHACHIADILLHISPSHSIARERAKKILKGIASYLKFVSETNNGFLLESEDKGGYKESLQLTTWYYALSERLGNQLTKNWETNLIYILSKTREEDILRKSFLVMNLAELLFARSSNMKETTIRDICNYFETYYNDLSTHLSEKQLKNTHLSIFGRALLYCNFAVGNDLRYI